MRNDKGQFVKGQSGNPAGKPPGVISPTAAMRLVLAQTATGDKTKAIAVAEKVVELAMAGDVGAIKIVFDRTDGAVLQKVAPTTPDGEREYTGLTDTERAQRLLVALQRLGEGGTGPGAGGTSAGGNMGAASGTADDGGGE